MALQDGDVVAFDYELWVEGHPKLHDTTLRAAAEREGLVQEDAWYGPLHYVLGSGRIIPGLDRALRTATVGQTSEVAISAADAYGERQASLVETVPLNEFKKNDVAPAPGLQITYKNRRGTVITVGGGRVRVDFNPALAGKSLRYNVTLRSVAKDDAARVAGIVRMDFPSPLEWNVQVRNIDGRDTAVIEVPEAAAVNRNWLLAKYRILSDVRQWTQFHQVRFVETYTVSSSGGSGGKDALEEPSPPASATESL